EEAVESSGQLRAVGIDPIFLVTPTTTEARIAAIAAQAAGFLYYVSLKGTTGAAHLDVAAVASRLPMIRRFTGLPVAVGFGIREAATAKAMAQVADAIVIGSRIIEEMEAVSTEQAVQAAEKFVAGIRIAIDNAPVVRAA
ncbi:MAG TPA: geranylgeranylglyceryl/heptaprenylglyceryl phosphate synthase, partial [Burkholderiaceae bacterium]|nr:geranylgeranylglyceryl/heptaprenylglyceryl phosphate synthase [Burkholderiaceae bacterium]